MDSSTDEYDLADSPQEDEEDLSILDGSTQRSFGLTSASTTASDSQKGKRKLPPRNLAYSGISHQTSRSTLLSAQDSQIGDGDIEEGNVANVSVVARVRPLSESESKRNDNVAINFLDQNSIEVNNDGKTKTFTFNAIFDPETSQQDVVDKCGIKKMVEMALEGYSCTAFAYGQTGSGKTFTITGPVDHDSPVNYGENYGLIQRSFMYLFDLVQERRKTVNYTLTASYLEIYNEQVKDLLNPFGRDSLPVRWSKDKGFYVENLFVVDCETQDDILAVLEEGMSQRSIAHNNINEYSSRSHTIMALQIDLEMPDPDDENLYITKHGRLSFVDLAGSEKVKELGSSGELLTETTNINKSLLTLGNCISALGDSRKRNGHIPYRDSKLTKLLADSLGGTGITLMIACVSPSKYCVSESLNTLRYANRARRIKNKPVVRMDPREKLILSLKREVKLLRNENHYLRERLKFPKGAIKAIKDSPSRNGEDTRDEDDDKTPVPMETRKVVKRQSTNSSLASSAELFSPKSAADNSLYEMLQEYMMENETLRSENSDLHNIKMRARREHEHLSKENDKLLRKLEELERVFAASPFSVPGKLLAMSRTTSGHSTITNSDTSLNLESVSSTPHNMTPTNPLPISPWKQQQQVPKGSGTPRDVQQFKQPVSNTQGVNGSPNQLPPVDHVKGVPNGYRSTHPSAQQYSPPIAPMPLGNPPQMPYPGPALRQIYPTSQQGVKNSYPVAAQKGPKKFSDTSRSFPPPSNNYQNPPSSGMQQDNGPPSSQGNQRKVSPSSFPQAKPRNSPSTHTDAYGSLPSTSSTKSVSSTLSRKEPTRKNDIPARNDAKPELLPVTEQGSKPQKSPRKALVQQTSAVSTGGGYSNRGTGHNNQSSAPNQGAGSYGKLNSTPAEPPPQVKYKPKGTSDMLAQTSNLTKPPPDSGSLNKINEKLRQELQDLDGEIEYMKYVNKTHTNIQPNGTTKTKGKKR
ncbi:uncharacterized protein [Amphiura filiformis]|uniref:uncharacterized protein n=1 Tax=Amphiura filiformis TaxID=82378 RepID=UPI003B21547B